MSTQQSIEVTSHVARDFLQNAAYFNRTHSEYAL